MTEVLRHDMDELAIAVVLRYRIGASSVHATGDLSAGILEFGVPADELPDHFGVAEAKQRRAGDRKSTRLNSSHSQISYAVFCLKKKNVDTSQFTFRAGPAARRADLVLL